MDRAGTCPQCGEKEIGKVEGDTFVLECPNCNWSVATSYFSMISKDASIYEIRIDPDIDVGCKEKIKIICAILETNFVRLAKMVKNKEPLLVKSNVLKTRQRLDRLSKAKIRFNVAPPFPWRLSDGTVVQ